MDKCTQVVIGGMGTLMVNGQGTFSVDPANNYEYIAIRMKDTKTGVVTETSLGLQNQPNWSGTATAPKAATYEITARLYTRNIKTKIQIYTDAAKDPPPPPYTLTLP